jgi:hypothetical protein
VARGLVGTSPSKCFSNCPIVSVFTPILSKQSFASGPKPSRGKLGVPIQLGVHRSLYVAITVNWSVEVGLSDVTVSANEGYQCGFKFLRGCGLGHEYLVWEWVSKGLAPESSSPTPSCVGDFPEG